MTPTEKSLYLMTIQPVYCVRERMSVSDEQRKVYNIGVALSKLTTRNSNLLNNDTNNPDLPGMLMLIQKKSLQALTAQHIPNVSSMYPPNPPALTAITRALEYILLKA